MHLIAGGMVPGAGLSLNGAGGELMKLEPPVLRKGDSAAR